MINEKIDSILAEIQDVKAKTEKEIEEFRIHLLGKKGEITQLFEEFRTISADKKREYGQKLNNLKNMAAAKDRGTPQRQFRKHGRLRRIVRHDNAGRPF